MFWGKNNKLERVKMVFLFALVGTSLGIIFGFLFGFVISEVIYLVATSDETIPREMVVFFGMGFGAVISSVVSVVLALKD